MPAQHRHSHHYLRLAIMAVLSFAAMYVLMYAMVDRLANVFPNVNQAYMAGLMTAPMVIIELLVMGMMYENRTANIAIIAASVVAGLFCWFAIRDQTAIGNVQFVRSMIPHHSGAILMCREATLTDAALQKLCGEIIEGQQREIDQMKTILGALDRTRQAAR
jgi:uncharacterized protein (DUF305 family)